MSALSHAYVDGSFIALCGYLRGAREPMNAAKPRCQGCAQALKFAEGEYQRGLLEGQRLQEPADAV